MKFLDYWSYVLLSLSKLFFFSWLTATAFNVSLFFLNLSTVLLLTGWALAVKHEWRRWILYTSLFLHSTLLISDVWYYRYFDDFLSVALLSDFGQMGDVEGGFLTLIRPIDFLFFIDLLIYGGILLYMRRHPVQENKQRRHRLAVQGSLLGLFLFSLPLVLSHQREEAWLTGDAVSNMREYYHLGFWGYHGLDVARGLGSVLHVNQTLTLEERQQVQSLSFQPVSASNPRTNVIVLQLESFQTSVIGQSINGQALTPNLNRLRDEVLYFPNFYHQTHEGRTSDAEFITNTSLYPLKSGSVYTRFPDHAYHTLSTTLKDAGYETAAMHAFKKDFWNRNDFYQNTGFTRFFSKADYPDNPVVGMGLNDKDFLSTSVTFMEGLEQPFYAFLVALSSHTPYDIPEDQKRLDLTGVEDPLLQNYYHTVHFVDTAVGQMIDQLKQKKLWEDTLVVMYGDHDSGLTNEDGEMAIQMDARSPVDLFRLDRTVPLFIKTPQQKQGQFMEASGGQIDLAPTILHLLGMTSSHVLGDSLLNDEPNLTVFRDGSFRYKDRYYVPDLTKATGQGMCYSIRTGQMIPLEQCEPQIEIAESQLRLSDTIIEKNAFNQLQPSR
ncbi:LTA synthase family protein [Exiguobacterium algae]|uniref:LTA synthase family protein n=1 Tax=Exiguobacterium algae TaxID=2751250 RepID=UPI001BE715FB|nr:LTA synthase family protein [Exiguobacterium algae]